MPRYVVERSFAEGLRIPSGIEGRKVMAMIVACNSDRRVTWISSYVLAKGKRTFCVYEGPSPEAVRLTAHTNNLPVDRITEISVLDPYFHF